MSVTFSTFVLNRKPVNYYITLILVSCLFIACGQQAAIKQPENTSALSGDNIAVNYPYDSLPIPQFLSAVSRRYSNRFAKTNTDNFKTLCESFNIDAADSTNIRAFYSIKILHDLFTANGPSNGSRGNILNIPYFWHWVTPNSRYDIRFTETGKLLKETKAPVQFAKYNSYADIDRVPALFLTDMFTEKPKYYSPACDTFSTFGWCSEREMAFVSLLDILKYKAKIMTQSNHCWTELILPMKSVNGQTIYMQTTVDNTYNNISWEPIKEANISLWEKQLGNVPLKNWYNQNAHSVSTQKIISTYIVSRKTSDRLQQSIEKYLRSKQAF